MPKLKPVHPKIVIKVGTLYNILTQTKISRDGWLELLKNLIILI